MGWERKRGKLARVQPAAARRRRHQLHRAARRSQRLPAVRYVITLDSDTQLPLEAGRQLVGTLAHPLNRPRLDARGRGDRGLRNPPAARRRQRRQRQPLEILARCSPATSASIHTPRRCPTSIRICSTKAATSARGSTTSTRSRRRLAGRVPENTLLSHDLFEGSFARVALCTDLRHRRLPGSLPDLGGAAAPMGSRRLADCALACAPWLARPLSHRLPRSLEDSRQSAAQPGAVLAHCPAGRRLADAAGRPALWTGVAFFVLFFPVYMQWGQSLSNRIQGVRLRDHLRAERDNLQSSLQQVLLTSAFLAHQCFVMLDAISRTFVRLAVTRRHLLEWVTAADAAAGLQVDQIDGVSTHVDGAGSGRRAWCGRGHAGARQLALGAAGPRVVGRVACAGVIARDCPSGTGN